MPFGRSKEPFLRQFLALKHGIPSHDSTPSTLMEPRSGPPFEDRAERLGALVPAPRAGPCLGRQPFQDRSNEITAMPTLLALLDLHGATMTVNAMRTQRATAEQETAAEGKEKGHGRIEVRKDCVWQHSVAGVCHDVGWLHAYLAAFGAVDTAQKTRSGTSAETRHFITSEAISPERPLQAVRAQWRINCAGFSTS